MARMGMAGCGAVRIGKERQGKEKTMKKVNVSELILDYNLYPRVQIDNYHTSSIADAIVAGHKMPPVIADQKSKRVVDGFHRISAMKYLYKEKAEIEVIFKKYDSEKAIFLDSVKYNADHGRVLTKYDRTHCVLAADKLHIDPEIIAEALRMTKEAVGKLKKDKTADFSLKISGKKEKIPLKRTISHMSGKTLTENQVKANEKIGGMHASFYVNQIIILVENNLIDRNDDNLLKRLKYLNKLLSEF